MRGRGFLPGFSLRARPCPGRFFYPGGSPDSPWRPSLPELPDLVHIVKTLGPGIEGRRITHAVVKNPVVLRVLVPGSFPDLVAGKTVASLVRHGPFLKFGLRSANGDAPDLDLVMHLMLAGRLRLAGLGERGLPATAFSLELDEVSSLHYGDEKSMGKVYLGRAGEFESIPGYLTQGVDVTSPAFTFELFSALIEKKRCQARVFIMDQSLPLRDRQRLRGRDTLRGAHPSQGALLLPGPRPEAIPLRCRPLRARLGNRGSREGRSPPRGQGPRPLARPRPRRGEVPPLRADHSQDGRPGLRLLLLPELPARPDGTRPRLDQAAANQGLGPPGRSPPDDRAAAGQG